MEGAMRRSAKQAAQNEELGITPTKVRRIVADILGKKPDVPPPPRQR